jgi:SAM-dependent methyltransferase
MLGKEDTPLQPREEWPVRRYHQHGGPFSISRPGKLLDLGSDPTLRDTLRQNGWKICHQHSQSNLEREVYDALHLEHEFDGVNLMYGLQTVGHPMRFLRELRRLLKPDGRLYLRVANIDGLGFWLFGPNWTGLHLPYFVVHLTPWTVQLILERAGFRLLQMSSGWCSAWISRSATTTLRRRLLTLLSFPPFAWMTALHASLTRQADVIAVVATPGQQQ